VPDFVFLFSRADCISPKSLVTDHVILSYPLFFLFCWGCKGSSVFCFLKSLGLRRRWLLPLFVLFFLPLFSGMLTFYDGVFSLPVRLSSVFFFFKRLFCDFMWSPHWFHDQPSPIFSFLWCGRVGPGKRLLPFRQLLFVPVFVSFF